MDPKKLQELKDKGLSGDELEKALQEAGVVSEEDMQKALDELDALTKSESDAAAEDDLDSLLKALEDEESALEALAKSEDDDEDDLDGDSDPGDEEDDEDFGKSLEDDELTEELVKASEAYAALEESIHKSMGDIRTEQALIHKAVLNGLNLQIKTAKAVAQLAKSLEELGASPAGRAQGFLGMGTEQGKQEIKKSRSEIQADLFKAVQEKRVDSRFLSVFAVRGEQALPDFVRKEIGL